MDNVSYNHYPYPTIQTVHNQQFYDIKYHERISRINVLKT